MRAIDCCDLVLAILDGPDVDSTAAEIDYAFARGKLVLGYRDFQLAADNVRFDRQSARSMLFSRKRRPVLASLDALRAPRGILTVTTPRLRPARSAMRMGVAIFLSNPDSGVLELDRRAPVQELVGLLGHRYAGGQGDLPARARPAPPLRRAGRAD